MLLHSMKLAILISLLTDQRVLNLVQVAVCFRVVLNLGSVLCFDQRRFNDTEQLHDRPIAIQAEYSHRLATH